LLAFQGPQFAQGAGQGVGRDKRNKTQHQAHGDQGGDADKSEGRLPTEQLTQSGGNRHAQQGRDGQPQNDIGDGRGGATRRAQKRGNQGGNTKVGAVRETCQKAGD